jgi:trigger factor
MKTRLEKIENNKATVIVEVEPKQFEAAMERSYRKNVKKIVIPGFRKGKAPRKIIESHYGEAIFYEDAVNFVITDTYGPSIEQLKIEPVNHPDFDVVQLEKDKPFIYKAEVTVKPEVKLGEYKGIEAQQIKFEITEETINDELEKLRNQHARLVTVERPAQNGDLITLDFEGFIDDKPFEGGKAENYRLELGSGSFIPGFEEQLIGMSTGDEKCISVKFPSDYFKENLAGKDASFQIKIKDIKEKQLSEIDDEFAKDVSEFKTLQELKDDMENKLKEKFDTFSRKQVENEIVDKVMKNTQVEIPEVMIENRIQSMINDMAFRLRFQGMSLEKYLEASKLTLEDLKNQMKDDAYYNVKMGLTLEAVAKAEDIKPTEDEVEQRINEMAKGYNKGVEEFKKTIKEDQLEYIKDSIATQKTLDFLVDNAKISLKTLDKNAETEEKPEAESKEVKEEAKSEGEE